MPTELVRIVGASSTRDRVAARPAEPGEPRPEVARRRDPDDISRMIEVMVVALEACCDATSSPYSDLCMAVPESLPVSALVAALRAASRGRCLGPPRPGQLEQDGPDAVVPVRVPALPHGRADVAVPKLGKRGGAEFGQLAVHVAGKREERVPLAVAEPPDEVPAVPPGRVTGFGVLEP